MYSSQDSSFHKRRRDRYRKRQADRQRFLAGSIVLLGLTLAVLFSSPRSERTSTEPLLWRVETAPLVMKGGDPYIRALMRTILASEASDPQPYSILYGGEQVNDLSRHPDRCITIVAGPNRGNCSTAAGRYQFLTTTWLEKAQQYHPAPPAWYAPWGTYSFEPEFQDQVVYAWLSDPYAWGYDLAELLKQGELDLVLRILSGTWTSLGYGIEDNVVTSSLPRIYEDMLQQELEAAQNDSDWVSER